MDVRVDEAGHDGVTGQIDDARPARDGDVGADLADAVAADDDDGVADGSPAAAVDEGAGADGGDAGGGGVVKGVVWWLCRHVVKKNRDHLGSRRSTYRPTDLPTYRRLSH
jgi:hypothetical protein